MAPPPHDDGHPIDPPRDRGRLEETPRSVTTEGSRAAGGGSPSERTTSRPEKSTGEGSVPRDELLHRRLITVLEVAALHETSLSVDELPTLLPESGPSAAADVVAWIQSHPSAARVEDGRVTPWGAPSPSSSAIRERRDRGQAYWEAARGLVQGPMAPALPFAECLGVTGSAAYQEPVEGDDIDLMAITKPGMAWIFLALAFARLRLLRSHAPPAGSHWCLNYVVDGRRARREYSRPQGFLFAREALTARMIRGAQYYQDLLARANWMEQELPRFYRKMVNLPPEVDPPKPPVNLLARVANLAVFPLLATYLQLVGLVRNHVLAKTGRREERFRTVTRLDRFELRTTKFEDLRDLYQAPAVSAVGESPA